MSEKPVLSILVPVRAVPGANSKRGFVNPRTGRVILVDKTKGKDQFVATVRQFAAVAADEAKWKPIEGSAMLSISFTFARPAGHYGTGKNSGKIKPVHVNARPTGKPDLTNIVKRTEDALKGITWHDDAQVVSISASKHWGETDLIAITVAELDS